MNDFFDLSGPATEWEDPYPEKGRCKVGGKAVWVFRMVYGTEDEVSPQYEALKAAATVERWVKVTGKQDAYTKGPAAGKPRRTVYDVLELESEVNGGGNGSNGKASTPTPARSGDSPRGDSPEWQERQRLISAQWAINAGINISLASFPTEELTARGFSKSIISLPIEEKAKYLLALARDLATEKPARANPSPPPQEPPPAVPPPVEHVLSPQEAAAVSKGAVPEGWGE